jgi:anti-sigma B factor antagonist
MEEAAMVTEQGIATRAHVVRDVVVCGDTVFVALAGELDLYTAPQLGIALDRATAAKPRRLVIDLAEVEFLDSTTIHLLLRARKRLADWAGVRLVDPIPAVRRTLEVSGVDRILPIADRDDQQI